MENFAHAPILSASAMLSPSRLRSINNTDFMLADATRRQGCNYDESACKPINARICFGQMREEADECPNRRNDSGWQDIVDVKTSAYET
jgi:hypothetical protein